MLIRNATLADGRRRDVRVAGERIEAVARRLPVTGEEANEDRTGTKSDRTGSSEKTLDATGKLLLPGMIDAHVHAREPGFPHKGSWTTLGRTAAAGGVTTVVDQPNTDPPTVDGASFDRKATLAERCLVDYGINGGVTPEWRSGELFDRPLFALGEVFLADSTGEMGIESDLFEDAVREASERGIAVTVHAEDASLFSEEARERTDADAWSAFRSAEAERAAIEQACAVGERCGAQLHVAHTSTPEGIDVASEQGMTCEVTPHHLFLSRADLEDLGTEGRMNPPLRSEARRKEVFERVVDGTVDIVATDHAPHTRAEKDAGIWDAPSGVPGVETALPLLLAAARRGELSYERIRDLTAANPAAIFDLPRKGRVESGKDADLVCVDPDGEEEIRGQTLHSSAGWTPFEGSEGVFPEWTMVRGQVVYKRTGAGQEDGEDASNECFGDPIGENVHSASKATEERRSIE
ncbi:dihydroorotase [Halobacteriales archaeon QS_3_64_16]|nr:MAG: dihydroorotase [Halobacteriales archaeon QS_3_64_16]